MVVGGLLYGLEPTYPFVAAVTFNSLGFITLLSLPKNRQYADHSDAEADRLGPLEALTLVREHLARPPLRSLVLYVGLFYAVVGVAHTYVQPMAVETLAPTPLGSASGFPQVARPRRRARAKRARCWRSVLA